MKKIMTLALMAIMACSCNVNINTKKLSGVTVTEEFKITRTYKTVNISKAVNVVLSPDVREMIVTADSVVISDFMFSCEDGVLEIGRRPDVTTIYNGLGTIDVVIPVSRFLTSVSVVEASSLKCEERIQAMDFTAVVATASKLEAEFQVRNLKITASEASSAMVSGTVTKDLMCTVTTASKLSSDKEFLEAEETYVNISGASSAFLKCTDVLSGTVSGASKLTYSGDCECSVAVSGASKLQPAGAASSSDFQNKLSI